MKSCIPFLLCLLALVHSQSDPKISETNEDDDDKEETVKSKPVIIRLPKNRLSPELSSISSIKKKTEIDANEDDDQPSGITRRPIAVERFLPNPPNDKVPQPNPSPPPAPIPSPLSPVTPSYLPPAPLASTPSIPIQIGPPRGSAPSQTPPGSPSSPQNPLGPAALAAGSGLTNILANNPSLAKLLGGIGGSPPAPAGPPGAQGGLLGPAQGGLLGQGGALSSLGLSPPGSGGQAGPPGSPDAGLLKVISSLGKQLGGAVGLSNVIPGGSNAAAVGPSIPRISGAGGPPIAGIPNIPGLPVFPGSLPGQGGQLDMLQLVSAVSRRALNGSSVTDVFPPNQIQKVADNLTDTLLPDTPEIDLTKYMGRWFEGINSPRATDQRCVVHHYGGLTENGKTATYTALKIYREASEFGQVRYSIGYAFRGGRQPGMLQMHTSESAEPVPYWIYKVGPIGKDQFGNEQYEYAIVSNWIKYPVMVLVRDPDQFKRDHEESVLRWLEEQGFINSFIRAFNLVQPVTYQNCQYAESTFELFG